MVSMRWGSGHLGAALVQPRAGGSQPRDYTTTLHFGWQPKLLGPPSSACTTWLWLPSDSGDCLVCFCTVVSGTCAACAGRLATASSRWLRTAASVLTCTARTSSPPWAGPTSRWGGAARRRLRQGRRGWAVGEGAQRVRGPSTPKGTAGGGDGAPAVMTQVMQP